MPSLSSVFGSGPRTTSARGSKTSLAIIDEHEELCDSLRGVSYLMNDEVDRAEQELQKHNSAYHKLGYALVSFMRATLGFERDIMAQAAKRCTAAETAASDALRQAQRDNTGFMSDIYPMGTEYVLCNAEAQLMSSVVSLLAESLTEALKGFYKVRKAVFALQSIGEAEVEFQRRNAATAAKANPPSNNPERRKSALERITSGEDDDVFVDAEEDVDAKTAAERYHGHYETDGILQDLSEVSLDPTPRTQASSPTPTPDLNAPFIDSALLSNPTDLFIHSGYCLHRGMMLVMLSLVPPSFSRILSIVGFRGDRERGLVLLWEAVRCATDKHESHLRPDDPDVDAHSSINGAIAGLIILGFYRGLLSGLDILPSDTVPEERLQMTLRTMRSKFPGSRLWILEESRLHSSNKDARKAMQILEAAEPPSSLKQVEALRWFEHGMCSMWVHDYQKAADSFIKCVSLNNWSHGLYYYIAGSAHVEIYRTYRYSTNIDSKEAAKKADHHKKLATEYLGKVIENTGKKKFIGRQLPFDAFVARKIQKWQARAKEWGVDLVSAAGVAPIEEIIYFWGGYKKMRDEDLHESLDRLWWSDGGALETSSINAGSVKSSLKSSPFAAKEPVDERASLSVLRAIVYRQLGDTVSARELLSEHVIDGHDNEAFKGGPKDNWTPPVARYEKAVCAWVESGVPAGRKVDPILKQEKLVECGKLLQEVANWGSYDLDTRIGIKVTTGLGTLKKMGITV